MIGRVTHALRDTALYAPARRVYRAMAAVRLQARNALPGACTVRLRGARNRVVRPTNTLMRGVAVFLEGDDNSVQFHPDAQLTDVRVTIRGTGNTVVVGASRLDRARIVLTGSRNAIGIADGCTCLGVDIVCEDDANDISIGAATVIAGATELAAIEGTRIAVGGDCLFSGGIHIRTGDSHSITDLEGRRINPSKDIRIGTHVWVGRSVTVLKGAAIADHSVVGAASVVTKRFDTPHCVIAGNPAQVIRERIDWQADRA